MTTRRRLSAGAAALPALWSLGLAPSAAAQQPRRRRVALVVGNAQYSQAPLPNPENDARLIGDTLGSLGFEVDAQFNLKTRDFKRALREFGRHLDDDGVSMVFFYAGHGMQIERRNFLLPTDLNLRDEGEVRDEAIDLADALLGRIDRVRPAARIFIIDACRDNPFSAVTRSLQVSRGLAEMAAPGALIAFSAAPGRTAEDGPPGGNSIYTRILAKEMTAEGVEIEEMMKSVRVKVLRETGERQLPFLNTSMVTNFYFNPGGALAAAPASLPKAPARRMLQVSLQAERSLNTDRQQAPATLALRIYVLRDAVTFERASFDSLYDNDEATLGAALLQVEALHLRPGETRDLAITLPPEARHVAVFAAYREVEQARWRTVLALPGDGGDVRARLSARARQVELGWLR